MVKEQDLQYLLAATLLTGLIQIAAGILRAGDALKFVPRPVMIGFVNSLGILIFLAQFPEFHGARWKTFAMVTAGVAIVYILPSFTKAVPSSLVCIGVLSVLKVLTGMQLCTVADIGTVPSSLPTFLLPHVPLNFETLWIILPNAISLAAVGLLESLMTAVVVDDFSVTSSNKNRACIGQGLANLGAGSFGGMAVAR